MEWLKGLFPRCQPPPQRHDFGRVTEEDLYYCYRLLLQREPDPAGWEAWTRLIGKQALSIASLVENFLHSEEYLARQAQRHTLDLVSLDRFSLYVRQGDTSVGGYIAGAKTYEPAVTREISSLLRPGDTFLDIGANIGYFSLLAASLVGDTGCVLAFEPNPDNCQLLRRSLLANSFERVRVYNFAVAEADTLLQLVTQGASSNAHIAPVVTARAATTSSGVLIQAVALDAFLNPLPRLDIVKMDIEGAEPRALQGMQGLIETHKPILLTEFSPDFIRRVSQVEPETYLQRLLDLGYDLFVLDDEGTSAAPQDISAITHHYQATGLDHIDLVARPRSTSSQGVSKT